MSRLEPVSILKTNSIVPIIRPLMCVVEDGDDGGTNTAGIDVLEELNRLLFLHAHHEASALANELPEEFDQFRFLHATCLAHLKGSVRLILAKVAAAQPRTRCCPARILSFVRSMIRIEPC
jgi:hypothetical protein